MGSFDILSVADLDTPAQTLASPDKRYSVCVCELNKPPKGLHAVTYLACDAVGMNKGDLYQGKNGLFAAPKNRFCDGNDFDAICEPVCIYVCVRLILCICPGVLCRSNALAV